MSDMNADLRALSDAARGHGGVPVGVAVVSRDHAQPFRMAMEGCLPGQKVRFPRVDQIPSGLLAFHLPPAVAAVFEGPLPPLLASAMRTTSAIYYSGVRECDPLFGRAPNLAKTLSDGAPAPRFTFAEMFAGIGGFGLGLVSLGGLCVLASEMDRHATATYQANFGANVSIGNVVGVAADQMPPFDVLTGGFPCQSFSNRGAQAGLGDAKGQLYHELVRLLKHHQPKAFLFENVVGLVIIDGGSRSKRVGGGVLDEFVTGLTFDTILEAFAGCGYDVTWRIVNARHWLPQYRERVFIAGFRRDLNVEMDWALDVKVRPGQEGGGTVRDILLHPAHVGGGTEKQQSDPCQLNEEQWAAVQCWCAAQPPPCSVADRAIPIDGKAPTLISSYGKASNVTSKYIMEEADGTQRDGSVSTLRPRYLRPRECARLMGFPDSFVIPGIDCPESCQWFYRQIGNAVCPPVVQSIASNMLRALEGTGLQDCAVGTGSIASAGSDDPSPSHVYTPAGGVSAKA